MSALLMTDSHTQGGLLSILRHPYLNSFLTRSFLCAFMSFIALITVSLLTPRPAEAVQTGVFSFSWKRGEGESDHDLRLAGIWMAVLFISVTTLFWIFR